MRISNSLGGSARFRIRHHRAVEVRLQPTDSPKAHPGRDRIGRFHSLRTDVDHRDQRVFRLLEMRFLLEVERVREQCWSDRLNVLRPMRLDGRTRDADQMRCLSALTY